jgi:site-specific recombinase XerD
MMQHRPYKKVIRVFLASPGDVAADREQVRAVVQGLNKTNLAADWFGVTREVLDWATHVAPLAGRPEQVILDQLPVETWDVFVGILWTRFGTPTGATDPKTGKQFASGAEEEFRLAYEAWRKTGRPHVMFYRCVREIGPHRIDPEQLKRVNDFFAGFSADAEHPGLYAEFEDPRTLGDLVREGLERLLLKYASTQLHVEDLGSSLSPAVGEALARFVETLRDRNPRTESTYLAGLSRLSTYLSERHVALDTPTASLPAAVFQDYRDWLSSRIGPTRASTINTYLSPVRGFLRFLERHGWAPRGGSYELLLGSLASITSPAPSSTRAIDLDELDLVVSHIFALPTPPYDTTQQRFRLALLRDRAIILTLRSTGLHREQLVQLNRTDVNGILREEFVTSSKGRKIRSVVFDPPCQNAIQAYLAARGDDLAPLFLRHDRARRRSRLDGEDLRISPQSVWNIVRRYAAQVGVRATPRSFRQYSASSGPDPARE